MTAQTIARDAFVMLKMTSHRPLRTPAADPKIARMDEIEISGKYDKTGDGLRRSREGRVGDAMMTCQVATHGGDTLLLFWSLEDGHQRRILVTANWAVHMDVGERTIVIGAGNKYFAPCQAVLAARAN